MKKDEYIRMLLQDNATAAEPQKEINDTIIDCVDIALSQMPANFEIEDTQIGLSDFWSLIQKEGRSASGHCVSPLRAAELIAEKLGAKFERASRRYGGKPAVRSLEDFL